MSLSVVKKTNTWLETWTLFLMRGQYSTMRSNTRILYTRWINNTLLRNSSEKNLSWCKKIILSCVFPCISRCVPSTKGSITMSISGYIGEIYFPGQIRLCGDYPLPDLDFETPLVQLASIVMRNLDCHLPANCTVNHTYYLNMPE